VRQLGQHLTAGGSPPGRPVHIEFPPLPDYAEPIEHSLIGRCWFEQEHTSARMGPASFVALAVGVQRAPASFSASWASLCDAAQFARAEPSQRAFGREKVEEILLSSPPTASAASPTLTEVARTLGCHPGRLRPAACQQEGTNRFRIFIDDTRQDLAVSLYSEYRVGVWGRLAFSTGVFSSPGHFSERSNAGPVEPARSYSDVKQRRGVQLIKACSTRNLVQGLIQVLIQGS